MSQLPTTEDEILATGVINSEFEKAVKAKQMPPGSFYTIKILKEITEASLPWTQKKLQQNRPFNLTEYERLVALDNGHRSRLLFCHRKDIQPTAKCPLIVLMHGGGHCVGNPESEIPLARRLALDHNAIVVLPSYRLAPEHPFPASVVDCWAIVKYLAAEWLHPRTPQSPFLPPQCDLSYGFIVAGSSAGANLAASVAHLARDQKLNPPLTGQMLMAGTFISYMHVPKRYQPYYLSREQNRDAPLLDLDMCDIFQDAFQPDYQSPLWALFDQHHPLDQNLNDPSDPAVKHGHMGLPPAYFQICGLDVSRDDSLIYERVLREECDVTTRADLYSGYAHTWWTMFPELKASRKREDDAAAGVGWLLGLQQSHSQSK
ncbi:Alpha/Beta hydrolase protein [Truncatella angustata]|uniref:Alpha/Beta hydrolase protein n=1 Tax=Truncatella angustata TaxID=152316 RepID=A0A9P8UPD6_9PEZI|nr:Alpha/Beta hydrolase protein [Truncatella angustata]KAH6655908.1 Alpha/Beta hydrolase protein [Truncatella angustata]